jgi:CRISPR-associated protein Csm1
MTQEEKVLILGSLFHDIGKFEQRTKPVKDREKHQLLSSGFVNKLFDDKRLANIVYYHHFSDLQSSQLKGIDRILAEIVCEADNLASMERNPDPDVKNQQPLESIFTTIYYGKNDTGINFQPITDINEKDYLFPKRDFNSVDLELQYREWWHKFISEINKVNKEETETLITVLKKYLWCIPSSSYKTRSDVSLFEHSKLTAAFASCMFHYLCDKYKSIEKITDFANRTEDRYLLILADITGIQKYIYNIGHKGASKALKGRSFFLQQMLENIAYWLLDEKLKLPITNLIYSSGGKFYLLAPNTKETLKNLSEAQIEIESKFLEQYNGELGIITGHIVLSGNDFMFAKDKKGHLISKRWDELNKIIEINKKKNLSSNWKYELFETQDTDGDWIKCSSTGIDLIKKHQLIESEKIIVSQTNIGESKFIKLSTSGKVLYQNANVDYSPVENAYISAEQFNSQKLGYELKKENTSIVQRSYLKGYSVLGLNSFELIEGMNLTTNGESLPRHFLINNLDITRLKGESQKGFKFYGGNWHLAEFGEVLKRGEGIERLGVLRLDVDNLGLIFKEGFGNKATFGRVVQLSAMLDFFFSCYLNNLQNLKWDVIKGLNDDTGKTLKELMQIVYSGGDDVFIVGHWSVLPDVAIWINNKFQAYTCSNPNFSISAGIYLFDDKFPIYKAAIEAGEYESAAKQIVRNNKDAKKNAICFLDKNTPVSWKDFEVISDYAKNIYEWVEIGKEVDGEKKKMSKAFINRLYEIYNEYVDGKYQNWARWRWRASYSLNRLSRQYKSFEKEIQELAFNLFSNAKTEQEFIKLLFIIAQWTELLTRKKDN